MISSRTSGQLTAMSDSNVFKQKLNLSAAGIPESTKRMGCHNKFTQTVLQRLRLTYDPFYLVCHRQSKRPLAMIWPIVANMAQYWPHVDIRFPENRAQAQPQPPVRVHPNRKHLQHSLVDSNGTASTPNFVIDVNKSDTQTEQNH